MHQLSYLVKTMAAIEPEQLASLSLEAFAARLEHLDHLLPPARAEINDLLAQIVSTSRMHGD